MQGKFVKVLVEYVASVIGVVIVGGAAYAIGELVFGQIAQGGGPWTAGLMGLLAITFLTAGVIVGAGEPVYWLGRRENPHWGAQARKQIWKGAFLGAPTVVALLSLTEMDWPSIMGAPHPFFLLRFLLIVVGLLQYVATSPVRLLVYALGIPAELVMVLAMPIGAMLVRHVARPESLLENGAPESAAAGELPKRGPVSSEPS